MNAEQRLDFARLARGGLLAARMSLPGMAP